MTRQERRRAGSLCGGRRGYERRKILPSSSPSYSSGRVVFVFLELCSSSSSAKTLKMEEDGKTPRRLQTRTHSVESGTGAAIEHLIRSNESNGAYD